MATDEMIAENLHKKLTKRDGGTEVVAGVITAIVMIAIIFALPLTSGWVQYGLIFTLIIQGLGLFMKLAGWRSVTLNNEEQEYLKQNYGRRMRNGL